MRIKDIFARIKEFLAINKLDRFLFLAAAVLLLVFAIFNLAGKGRNNARRTNLILAREWEERFGRETMETIMREFEDRNPELGIIFENTGTEKRKNEQETIPDIVFFDEGRFGALVGESSLLSLNPYIRAETGGDQWAIPLVSFMDLLFYNIEILQSAGFDHPPRSRDEFLAFAKTLASQGQEGAEDNAEADRPAGTDRPAGSAMALSPADPLAMRRDILSWIWASRIQLIREGRPYFGDKAIPDILSFFGRLGSEGLLAPESLTKTGPERVEEFARGEIAMLIASVQAIPLLRERMGDSAFGITLIPGTANLPSGNGLSLSGWYAGINGGCAFPDEAWTFLAFLSEKSGLLAAQVQAVPGSPSNGGNFPDAYITNDPFYSKAWDICEAAEITGEFSGIPQGHELEEILREELIPLLNGQRSGADTAAAVQKRWDQVPGPFELGEKIF